MDGINQPIAGWAASHLTHLYAAAEFFQKYFSATFRPFAAKQFLTILTIVYGRAVRPIAAENRVLLREHVE